MRTQPPYADYDAFNTESLAWATPDELADLQDRLRATLDEWRASIDTDDDAPRKPIFFFAHGFPMQP